MGATIIYGDSVRDLPDAIPEGDSVWLSKADLARATGWEMKPEGLCRDEICIPIPPGREADMLRGAGEQTYVNLAGFAEYTGQPYASDERGTVWAFGEAPADIQNQLLSLEAPDFSLPAYDGSEYSLSAYRGKKVLLLLWSSW
jgi:hypothetical protein